MFLWRAEGVRAVLTGGTVTGDTSTVDLTADVAEQFLVVVFVDVVGDHTGVSGVHTVTQVFLWGWWQVSGGLPVLVGGWASQGGSGWGVRGGVCGGWGDAVDFLGVVVEVV